MGGSQSVMSPQLVPPYLGTGMVSIGSIPSMGFNMNPPCAGVRMASLGGNPQAAPPLVGVGMVQPSFIADNLPAGAIHWEGSTPQAGGAETTNKNTNPFLS